MQRVTLLLTVSVVDLKYNTCWFNLSFVLTIKMEVQLGSTLSFYCVTRNRIKKKKKCKAAEADEAVHTWF